MRITTKRWLITAAVLIAAGCVLFGGVMMALGWDFLKLGTSRFVTRIYTVSESFDSITVTTDTADVVFLPSEQENGEVRCYETDTRKHNVSVSDGVLTIQVEDTRRWYDYIGVTFTSPRITVLLPQSTYRHLTVNSSTGDVTSAHEIAVGAVNVMTGTGHIRLQNMTADTMAIRVSTGDVTMAAINCQNSATLSGGTGDMMVTNLHCTALSVNSSTGNIRLSNTVASDTLTASCSTGDITLNGCDAAAITVTTSTGDIKGRLLSGKTFTASADTGDVNVPPNSNGGTCQITTGTGDITITVGEMIP